MAGDVVKVHRLTRARRSAPATRLLVIALALGLAACNSIPPPAPHEGGDPQLDPPFATGPLVILTELYGAGGPLLEHRLRESLANGASLHPPLDDEERRIVGDTGLPFAYYAIPAEADAAACYPNSFDPDAAGTLRALGVTAQSRAWRLGAPEFDQGGGCWARNRPSLTGLSAEQAYSTWMRFYRETKSLGPHLDQPAEQRGYKWMSVCVYAFCPQYAYDLGSDVVLLERGIDEVSAMSPGLAMVRGAARQNGGREWGIDISGWRFWNDGPTAFDDSGRLVTGWSPATLQRIMFAAYMGGADMILNEAVNYGFGPRETSLNPLGVVARDFADFSMRRHPDRGVPEVPMAILQDHVSGFEPRFGEFGQEPRTWYLQNPYTPGDRMLSGLLSVAYPGHEAWGTIVRQAPWRVTQPDGTVDVVATQAAYRQALQAPNVDPRIWEPMGTTRWGESLDVVTDRVGLGALLRYRVVVLATSGPPAADLRADLEEYVRRGGTVVINASQLEPGFDPLTDVILAAERRPADSVTWSDGTVIAENEFHYVSIEPGRYADVVATTTGGAAAITRHRVGAGWAYLVAADRMLDDTGRNVLSSGRRLLDELHSAVSTVAVEGPALQYLVNKVGASTVVTLINTDIGGSTWRGRLRFRADGRSASVQEWITDTPVPSAHVADEVVVDAAVPPFGVHMYAMQAGG